jgi:hypothetical protein
MAKPKAKKDKQTKKKEKKAKKQRQSRAASRKKDAEEETMVMPKQEVKAEVTFSDDDNSNGSADPFAAAAPKPKPTPKPKAKGKRSSTNKATATRINRGSKTRALGDSESILRVADGELTNANRPSALRTFVECNSGSEYIPLPLLNILDYNKDTDNKTIHVLCFVWEDGQRTKMQFARCVVQDAFCAQPDEDDVPDEEPAWVTNNINTRDKSNLLVMVKNCDDKGALSRSAFPGQSASVLRVSPSLLFYKKKCTCKCTCGANRA